MRKLIIILIVIAALVAAIAIYLVVTTPKQGQALRLPLSDAQRTLLARVPASAEAFALVPSAALLDEKFAANPIPAEPLLLWTEEHELPRPWMLGGADVVAWKREKATSYAVRLDPFRALVIRVWLVIASNANARWDGPTLVMNDPVPSAPSTDLDALPRLASGLPAGDALIVQRSSQRSGGAFPPMGRPAVTSLRVGPSEIVIVSRAASAEIERTDVAPSPPVHAQFPRGAMLRAYEKATGKEVGAVWMAAPQSASPMTYLVDGKQYIVVAVSGGVYSGEYVAFALPAR